MAHTIDFDQYTEYKTTSGIFRVPLAAQPLDNTGSLAAIRAGLDNAAAFGRAVTLDAGELEAVRTAALDVYAEDLVDAEIADNTDPAVIVDNLLTVRSYPEWGAGLTLAIGDTVFHDGTLWVCAVAHTTVKDDNWRPGIAPNLWTRFYSGAGVQEWAYPVAYKGDNELGDGNGNVVTYGGKTWRCDQSHTSQAGWYPGAPGVYLWIEVT